jgi:hypothetical protein
MASITLAAHLESFINLAGTLKVHSTGFGWVCSCKTNTTVMGVFNAPSKGKFRLYKGSKMALSRIPSFVLELWFLSSSISLLWTCYSFCHLSLSPWGSIVVVSMP